MNSFTLIELLVVIAVVGLLVSIIIVNVWNAQLRAKDAVIQEAMFNLRTSAEKDFLEDDNYDNICREDGEEVGNSRLNFKEKKKKSSGDYLLFNEQIKNLNGGYDVFCNEGSGSDSYAAWSRMVFNPSHYWCIDSKMANREINSAPPIDSTVCP